MHPGNDHVARRLRERQALALTVEERTTIMKKKPAAKSKRRATRASTRDLLAKGKRVTGGRESTTHPAKVTVPDIKLSVSDGLA